MTAKPGHLCRPQAGLRGGQGMCPWGLCKWWEALPSLGGGGALPLGTEGSEAVATLSRAPALSR